MVLIKKSALQGLIMAIEVLPPVVTSHIKFLELVHRLRIGHLSTELEHPVKHIC